MLSLPHNGRRFRHTPFLKLVCRARVRECLASAPVRGFQRTVEGGGKPESFRRGCQVQGRAPRPYFVARSSGIGEDHAEQHHSQRTGRGAARHVGSRIGQAGRSGGAAHESQSGRRALHRRNPPAQSRSGGVSLFRHGGLPDRHHDRQRPVGTQHTTRLESLHVGGCHYAQRSAYRSPPCPFRYQPASGVL